MVESEVPNQMIRKPRKLLPGLGFVTSGWQMTPALEGKPVSLSLSLFFLKALSGFQQTFFGLKCYLS